MVKSLQKLLADDGFKVKSARATIALETASNLLAWCKADQNKRELNVFSEWLVSSLRRCFSSNRKSFVLRAEKMWEMFHALRTDTEFRNKWDTFCKRAIKQKATATVFQYITTRVFRDIIKSKFELEKDDAHSHSRMTLDEENALRYVSGYVCRKVQKKIEKSSHNNKDEMALLMIEFYGDELDDDATEEWTNQIDRGGLWHINNDMYLVFVIIEDEIRNYLHVKALGEINESTKKTILDALRSNEDLLSLWGMLTAHYGNDVPIEVLKQICELYVTVRGFSFATSCLELFKQQTKTQVQKSKGLRRKLQSTSSEDK